MAIRSLQKNYQLQNCGSTSNHILQRNMYIFCSDIKECISSPCQHGATCVDDVNGYSCICADGWTGVFCETSKYYSAVRKWQLHH